MAPVSDETNSVGVPTTGVVAPNLGGGPAGVGDPDNRSLRKVEQEILIPKKMRDKAKQKCVKEVQDFTECCAGRTVSMSWACRKENKSLKNCLMLWYQDSAFKEMCTQEYLEERSEFRRTGIHKKFKK